MAGFGAWGGESWYSDREGWVSASLSVPVHSRVTGTLNLSSKWSNLNAFFQDLTILLFVFVGSV